jgi:hypothetical protein
MFVTVSLFPSLASVLVPVPSDWGFFDCQRLASPVELAACGSRCCECGSALTDKHGWAAGGTVIGRRSDRTAPWSWSGVLCRPCEIAHSIADGYGNA